MPATTSWETLAAAHRARQLDAIPQKWILQKKDIDSIRGAGAPQEGKLVELQSARKSKLLSEKELDITEKFTATELLSKLANRELSSEEVVVAFCKRAAVAQQLTSCLTEIFFEEAIQQAKALDKKFQETGKIVGPLHGLPISLKDSFMIKGQYATVGYIEHLKRPAPDTNAALVDILLDAGAVLYCKTNVPQTMMTADSENNIFGRTLNPHNTSLTAGGSTGGEGSLVGFRGSILGVGTDIAGSIRIPSLCCGIYGFKPTADRIPFAGNSNYPFPVAFLPGVPPVAGPMAHSVDDLELFMKTVLGSRPWKYDSAAMDIPWRVPEEKSRSLVIGVMPEDPEYPLQPPVRRTLQKATAALEKAGHKIIKLQHDPRRAPELGARLGFQYFSMSGPNPEDLSEEIGEPLVKSVAIGVHPFSTGNFPVSPELELADRLFNLNVVRGGYAEAWKQTWCDNDLDVVLAPGAATTAIPHDTYGVPLYTLMWNVLDYPAGIIPYGKASKTEDPERQKAIAPFDPDYEPEAVDGAPCAIQVIAPRFKDEECLRAMRIIDEDIRTDEGGKKKKQDVRL